MKRLLLPTILFIFFYSSCVNYKYFSKYNKVDITDDTFVNKYNKYILQPNDYLYISIQSTNKYINDLYQTFSTKSTSENEVNLFLNGFLINDSGIIFIPTIGELKVGGLTLEDSKFLIDSMIRSNITDAIVNVRLGSFTITFLGEFSKSGKMQFYKNKLSILEAIAYIGSVNDYANVKKIRIYRTQDDKTIVFNVDISSKNLITETYFYLNPGDIVYAPPKFQKNISLFLKDYSMIISLVSSTVTITFLIIQLFNKK